VTRGRKALFIGGGVVLVLVGVFVAAYLLFFNDDSPPPLKLEDQKKTTGTTAAPASGLGGSWTTAASSSGEQGVAGYRVREKLAFLPAQSDAVGRTSSVTGSFTLKDASDSLEASNVKVDVDMTTLKSDESRRDNRIRRDGLETDTFKTATFAADGPIKIPGSARDGQDVTVQAKGDLTIHGVTKSVTIPIQARLDGSTIQLVGSLKFPMSDFDIDPPNIAGFVTVEPEGTMEFRLFFSKSA
jgi:polyisoprenoid-binding protein YceI